MMSPMGSDLNLIIDEDWLNFECENSMLALVSPDEICPVAICQAQQNQTIHYNGQQLQKDRQETAMSNLNPQTHQENNQNLIESQFDREQYLQQEHQILFLESEQEMISSDETKNQIELAVQVDHAQQEQLNKLMTKPDLSVQIIGPPPLLIPRQEKVYSIQQQLDFRRALAHQRCEQLRTQLANEPPKYPPKIIKKPSGKKMTGRERLSELERQERNLLDQRDHLRQSISQLETKCFKLREILGSIVANSPEYNNQMIDYLKADGLLIDSHIQ